MLSQHILPQLEPTPTMPRPALATCSRRHPVNKINWPCTCRRNSNIYQLWFSTDFSNLDNGLSITGKGKKTDGMVSRHIRWPMECLQLTGKRDKTFPSDSLLQRTSKIWIPEGQCKSCQMPNHDALSFGCASRRNNFIQIPHVFECKYRFSWYRLHAFVSQTWAWVSVFLQTIRDVTLTMFPWKWLESSRWRRSKYMAETDN